MNGKILKHIIFIIIASHV